MHTALYTRVSQDTTGERAGVTRQLDDCSMLAEKLGWTVVATFDDNDISAFSGKTRPGFEAMLDAIKRGEINAIICWHVDRLYRSMRDLERLIEIAEPRGVQIRTVNAGDIDLSNATGKMVARILASVSRQESEHKGERHRRANKQRAMNGQWRADMARVFGYTTRGEPFEPEATAVRQAIHDVLAGRSLRSIAAEWNEAGLRTPKAKTRGGAPWTNLTLRRTLIKPVYAGLVVYQGKVVGPGKWQAIVDEDTHRGLVAYLSDPSRVVCTSFERKHMGSGVYRCGVCGGLMYAMFPSGSRAMTYGCKPYKHVGRTAAPLDELVTAIVLQVLSRNDVASQLSSRDGIDITAMHAQRAALQAQRDELATLFADGVLDGPAVRRESAKLAAKIAGVEQVLAEQTAHSPAVQLLDGDPDELETRWHALSPDMKGKVVDQLMTVVVKPTPPGVKGIYRDRDTGARVVNLDYVRIEPKVRE